LPEVARRIEWLVREADKRGMVVMIGVITPGKDQDFYDDTAMQTAIEETAKLLADKKLNNVFVNPCDEFNHPLYADQLLIREPDGPQKKARLTAWFKAIAPRIEAGVGPHWKSGTADQYPTMDVRIIQKGMAIPKKGFVINVEPVREDYFQNDGFFNATNLEAVFTNCCNYLDAPNAVFMFHSGFVQGITNYSGTAPHGEMGGYGTGPDDRGSSSITSGFATTSAAGNTRDTSHRRNSRWNRKVDDQSPDHSLPDPADRQPSPEYAARPVSRLSPVLRQSSSMLKPSHEVFRVS
jgi:hypothetical protein